MRKAIGLAVAATIVSLVSGSVSHAQEKHRRPVPDQLVAQMSAKGMSVEDPILVRIFKMENELEVWKRNQSGKYSLLKKYPICRWSGQLGPKTFQGDRQAPEGFYSVGAQHLNPNSAFYLSYDLGYPNAFDRAYGRTGSALMVHGACTSAGCYAMTDAAIAEVYALAREALQGGQGAFQVQALPFRMTPKNMARHRENPNIGFWRNLKEGADYFELFRIPPSVAVCDRRYAFLSPARAGGTPELIGERCFGVAEDPNVAAALASKRERDDAKASQAATKGEDAARITFIDGSMHPQFQKLLKARGVAQFQRLTSGRVEVSRPDAALAKPHIVTTGANASKVAAAAVKRQGKVR